jgi:hypothetical protein
MSGAIRRLADRAQALAEQAREWEENHPFITRISPAMADAIRTIQNESGSNCVTCDLPCHGSNIPRKYDHINWKDSEVPFACDLAPGKTCITPDHTRRTAER